MVMLDGIVGLVVGIIDKFIFDFCVCDVVKLELLKFQGMQEFDVLKMQMVVIVIEVQLLDLWMMCVCFGFFYVMYVLLLWLILMGLIVVVCLVMVEVIVCGMIVYLNGIFELFYVFFGMGYFGYIVVCSWGKVKGVE